MNRNRNISIIIILGMIFIFSFCSKDDSMTPKDKSLVVLDMPSVPSHRLVGKNDHLSFTKIKSGAEGQENDLVFTMEYLLDGPTVDGSTVQASHIVYKANKLYLSYNTKGSEVKGGIEVIDLSDFSYPQIMAVGTPTAEFNSIDLHTDPSTGQSRLFLAGNGLSENGISQSQVQSYLLDGAGYPILSPEKIDLNGFTATDINQLGVVTGSNGGFYLINDFGFDQADYEFDLDDARSIAYYENQSDYVALLGNPGRLVSNLLNNSQIINLGGNSQAGSKSIVRIHGDIAFAALGDGGLKAIDLRTGQVVASMDRPDTDLGANEDNYVTNGISVHDQGYLFIANGAAGVFVAKYEESRGIEVLGFLDLDASVNYVEAVGEYLYVAAGKRGVAIIKVSGIYGPEPLVSTDAVHASTLTAVSATVKGEVDQNLGHEIINKGLCWGTFNIPTIDGTRTNSGPGAGSFSSSLAQLQPNTQYYFRAYAITSVGTFYGPVKSFTTLNSDLTDPGEFTDERDGRVYRTVRVGDQIWMAENLDYLPEVTPVASGSMIDPFYYVYGYNGFNVTEASSLSAYQTYGVLYNWVAANEACPEGWHLPTDQEWSVLEIALGMDANDALNDRFRFTGEVGHKLKSGTYWSEEKNGNNASGFGALPGGQRARGGEYKNQGSQANFWTSSEGDNMLASYRGLYYFSEGVYRGDWYKSGGFSVRCVKN